MRDPLKPPHPFLEFWVYFAQNRGALMGLFLFITFFAIAVSAPTLAPHDPSQLFPRWLRLPPIWMDQGQGAFPLGTDDLGRDTLARLIYGARVSMGVGFVVVVISMTTGTVLGLTSGYFGGWWDRIVMRVVDILMSLPSILLAIVVVSILGPGLMNAVFAVSVVALPGFIRVVRASVLSEKEKQYVIASRSFGAGHLRTMFSNILPNCMAPLIIQASLGFSEGILSVAALGFLGLGAQPPTPEWGTMLSDARPFIETSPWMVTLPGLCILLVVLGFNLMGDGLRDALDPRLRK